MPKNFMKNKAGKLCFLLVCIFLCTACGKEKTVFEAGVENVPEIESTVSMISDEPEKEKPEEKAEDIVSGKVNINSAGAEELMTLPGIGEVRALAIIEYRETYGNFENIEDIMNVKGIKTGVFSKINELICVK